MDIVLTHGVLPTEDQFNEQFHKYVDGGLYKIERDPIVGTDLFSVIELWYIIQRFYNSDDPRRVELVSCILETLSIEWV